MAQSWAAAKEDVEPALSWSPSMIVSEENLCILSLHDCVIKEVLKRFVVMFGSTDWLTECNTADWLIECNTTDWLVECNTISWDESLPYHGKLCPTEILFYWCTEHSVSHSMSGWMQAFYTIKLPCLGR